MSVESILKSSELLLHKAAKFDHNAEDFQGRAIAWRNIYLPIYENSLIQRSGYAYVANKLQETAWEDIRKDFISNVIKRKPGSDTLSSDEIDIIIRSHIMDYYTKKSSKLSK